jgi:hypothetical protein
LFTPGYDLGSVEAWPEEFREELKIEENIAFNKLGGSTTLW